MNKCVLSFALFFLTCLMGTARSFAANMGEWDKYIHTLQQGVPVFISACTIRKDDVAVAVFPLSSKTGMFFEIQTISNQAVATLNFSKIDSHAQGLAPEELAFGGADTLNYLTKVIRFLGTSKFDLARPADLNVLKSTQRYMPCPLDN